MIEHETPSRIAVQSTPPATPTDDATPELSRAGKVRSGALLWALGLPIPLVLLFLLFRGCS
jgi:hypothetical protein